MIWFKHQTRRWAFIQWLSTLGRLATKDRLISWGMQLDPKCSLCLNENESHSHLFFSCGYAQQVWSFILLQNGISSGPMDLVGALSWIRQYRGGNSMVHTVWKLSFAATIYWLWKERNKRVFQLQGLDCSSLQQLIIDDIRACLSSWRGFQFLHGLYPLLLLGASIGKKFPFNVLGV